MRICIALTFSGTVYDYDYRVVEVDSICPYAAQRRRKGFWGRLRGWRFYRGDGDFKIQQTSYKHYHDCLNRIDLSK